MLLGSRHLTPVVGTDSGWVRLPPGTCGDMTDQSNPAPGRASQDTTPSGGTREERLSRLDQLEREIAAERERLNRPDEARESAGRESASSDAGDGQSGSVSRVELPELEERVTESQREAWAMGYQAGIADAQAGTTERTRNPFHPLRD